MSEQYTPAQAAQQLEVSSAMMRRYHLTLEEVLGEPLPRHEVSNGRLLDSQHLQLLLLARDLVKREGMSIEHALRQLLTIPTAPPLQAPLHPPLQGSSGVDLAPVLEALERQSQEITALREEVSGLRQQLQVLDAPKEQGPRLRDEVRGLLRSVLKRFRG